MPSLKYGKLPFNPLIFRYLNYLFCGSFFKAVFKKLFGVQNDRLSLICVYDASWYFHILQILSNAFWCLWCCPMVRLAFGD